MTGGFSRFVVPVLLGLIVSEAPQADAAVMPLSSRGGDIVAAADATLGVVADIAPGLIKPLLDYASLDLDPAKCSSTQNSTTRAVLVGASLWNGRPILGAENDVALLAASLEARGVDKANIIRLVGRDASRESLAEAFAGLLRSTQCGDRVLVHFSGASMPAPAFVSTNIMPVVGAKLQRALKLDDIIQDLASGRQVESAEGGAKRISELLSELRHVEDAGLLLFLAPADAAADAPGAGDASGNPAATPPSQLITAADISELISNIRNRGSAAFVFLDVANATQATLAARQAQAGDTTTWVFETDGPEERAQPAMTPLLGARAAYGAFYGSPDSNNFENQFGEAPETRNGVFTYRLAVALQDKNAVTVRELAESLARAAKADKYGRRQRHRVEGSDPDGIVFTDTAAAGPRQNPIVITAPSIALRGGAIPIDRSIVELAGRVQWNAALAGIQVNGEPALVNPDGTFSATVELEVGKNLVEIVAYTVDRRMHVREIEFNFDGDLTKLAGDGQRYALLIANQDYGAETGFDKLTTPHNDVVLLKRILEQKYGFRTDALLNGQTVDFVLYDATQQEIGMALDQLNMIAGENDTVMIYYAGHGVVEEGVTTVAYWVPTDARIGLYSTYVDAAIITRSIARMKANKVIVVSDSCFSGALIDRSGEYATAAKIDEQKRSGVMLSLAKERTRILLSSGNVEPVPDNEGNGHSVFANAFADGLNRMAHKAFSGQELYDGFIRFPVMSRSSQEPQYVPMYSSGHYGGDIVFFRFD